MMEIRRCHFDTETNEAGQWSKVCIGGEDMESHTVPYDKLSASAEVPDGVQPGQSGFPKCFDCGGVLVLGGRCAVICRSCGSEFGISE